VTEAGLSTDTSDLAELARMRAGSSHPPCERDPRACGRPFFTSRCCDGPSPLSHSGRDRREKTAVLYCASGGRSALAGKTLQELGYKSVYNAGAFKDLAEAGLETEPA
jgi:rhodanese-related sulfurtransferase